MDISSGGAEESSGIFEKIFWVRFQFTKDTRYNKGMEHMEHFYKDDSSIITHTIWVILSLNCFETFCKISKADIICSLEKGNFSMKRMIGMISSLLRQSCRGSFRSFCCALGVQSDVHDSLQCVLVHFLALSRDFQIKDCQMSSNRLSRLRSPKFYFFDFVRVGMAS